MHGLADQAHPRLLQQAVPLAQVALEAGGDDVRPGRLPAPRPRQHVVDGQAIAAPVAVLARVSVAAEDVLLVEGHTVEERLADVDCQADHRREREGRRWRTDYARRRLESLGFT